VLLCVPFQAGVTGDDDGKRARPSTTGFETLGTVIHCVNGVRKYVSV